MRLVARRDCARLRPTFDFGSRPAEAFARVREDLPDVPLMVMEFWHGRFDHWGEEHHTRDAAEAAATLDAILAAGASVNFYMGVGSTNFGLWAGSNCGPYSPTMTSYDYDAPIAEDDTLTPKFYAFRDVIGRYRPLPELDPALEVAPTTLPPTPVARVGSVSLLDLVSLAGDARTAPHAASDRVAAGAVGARAATLEEVGLERGAMMLRRRVVLPDANRVLRFHGLRDHATVLVDGVLVGSVRRADASTPTTKQDPDTDLPTSTPTNADLAAAPQTIEPVVSLEALTAGQEVDLVVIVENEGRVNFGPDLGELKGITRGIWLGFRFINDWEVTPHAGIRPDTAAAISPSVRDVRVRGGDARGRLPRRVALRRGIAYVNGFCLGRYWNVGPQQKLYLPWPFLRPGRNTITILEWQLAPSTVEISFAERARL